jgi:hypothetical protein
MKEPKAGDLGQHVTHSRLPSSGRAYNDDQITHGNALSAANARLKLRKRYGSNVQA